MIKYFIDGVPHYIADDKTVNNNVTSFVNPYLKNCKGGTNLFDEFRQYAKSDLKVNRITYAELAKKTGFAENTIKCFMCGRNDSHKVAEKIADVLNIRLIYSDRKYVIEKSNKSNGE